MRASQANHTWGKIAWRCAPSNRSCAAIFPAHPSQRHLHWPIRVSPFWPIRTALFGPIKPWGSGVLICLKMGQSGTRGGDFCLYKSALWGTRRASFFALHWSGTTAFSRLHFLPAGTETLVKVVHQRGVSRAEQSSSRGAWPWPWRPVASRPPHSHALPQSAAL